MYYVYILKNEKGKFYTGLTNDIKRRIKEHNLGQHKTTKYCTDWELIFLQECESREEARQFEKHLKSGSFREIRKYLVDHRGVEQPGSSSGS